MEGYTGVWDVEKRSYCITGPRQRSVVQEYKDQGALKALYNPSCPSWSIVFIVSYILRGHKEHNDCTKETKSLRPLRVFLCVFAVKFYRKDTKFFAKNAKRFRILTKGHVASHFLYEKSTGAY